MTETNFDPVFDVYLNNNTDFIVTVVGNESNCSSRNHSATWELNARNSAMGNTVLILAYSLLGVISVFGNSLVCYVIFKNKRLHTATNFFIANLAISDLLVTFLNVPFNIVRHVMEEWPLGNFMCHLVNFSLMVSVYVSTYTLTSIAIDRHRVVLKPLTPRMSKSMATGILGVIWVVAVALSMPYGLYTKEEEMERLGFCEKLLRCRSAFPEPSALVEQYLTVATIALQYVVPLTIIGIAYGRIVHKLWARTHVGAVTQNQQQSQARAKKKSIKLLIAVVVVFALCWMPLNLYHLLTDLHPDAKTFNYSNLAFFICHWIAISSTCFNPFVYCWLNEHFRAEVKNRFRWCIPQSLKIHPGSDNDGALLSLDCTHPPRRKKCPSMTSSGRTQSITRRETTLTPDQEDLQVLMIYDKARQTSSNGQRNGREVRELIPKYENGRVEFHSI